MTKSEGKAEVIDLKGLLARDEDFVRGAVEALVQAALEAEMTEAIGAAKGRTQRDAAVVPQRLLQPLADHPGRHAGVAGAAGPDGAVFDRAVRALSALGEGAGRHLGRDVRAGRFDAQGQGGDRGLCGHGFSASSISAINKSLDEGLRAFADRRLTEKLPLSDPRCALREGARGGVIVSQAVLVAVAVDEDGRRQILASSSPIGRADRAGAISS